MANLCQLMRTATIANGDSLSDAIDGGEGRALIGVQTPAAWTAAAISFKASADGTTYVPLFDSSGTEVTIPSAAIATGAAQGYALDPTVFIGWRYVKIQSGTNSANTNQGAARIVTLVFREVN